MFPTKGIRACLKACILPTQAVHPLCRAQVGIARQDLVVAELLLALVVGVVVFGGMFLLGGLLRVGVVGGLVAAREVIAVAAMVVDVEEAVVAVDEIL